MVAIANQSLALPDFFLISKRDQIVYAVFIFFLIRNYRNDYKQINEKRCVNIKFRKFQFLTYDTVNKYKCTVLF